MSNRITNGTARVGALQLDAPATGVTGGVAFDRGTIASKVKAISYTYASTSEIDSGFDLPSNGVVTNVWAKITTAGATGTLEVGLLASESGGDADGFLDAVSVLTTGVRVGRITGTSSNNNLTATSTLGPYLAQFVIGEGTSGVPGLQILKSHNIDSITARSVSYTLSTGATSAAGVIFIEYREVL